MKQHFIGKFLDLRSSQLSLNDVVDMPLFNQKDAPVEFLFSIDAKDVTTDGLSKIEQYEQLADH
jgi:hypothetical protein